MLSEQSTSSVHSSRANSTVHRSFLVPCPANCESELFCSLRGLRCHFSISRTKSTALCFVPSIPSQITAKGFSSERRKKLVFVEKLPLLVRIIRFQWKIHLCVLYPFRENSDLDRKKYIENAKNRVRIEIKRLCVDQRHCFLMVACKYCSGVLERGKMQDKEFVKWMKSE